MQEFDYAEIDRMLVHGLRQIIDEDELKEAISSIFAVFLGIEDLSIRVYVMDTIIRHILDARNHYLKELEEEDAVEERFRKECD